MKRPISALVVAVSIVACANEVYREETDPGYELVGEGGAGGDAQSACGTPPVSAPLQLGSIAVVAGTGGSYPLQCIFSVRDDKGNAWKSDCSESGCSCQFNDVEVCSCTHARPLSWTEWSLCGHPDGGLFDGCCPDGWPEP